MPTFLLGLVIAVKVHQNPHEDTNNGAEHTDQGQSSKLVDDLHPEEDDGPHDEEHQRPVHPVVVEDHRVVIDVWTKQRHGSTNQIFQCDFHSTNDVHGPRYSGADVETDPDCSTKLRPEGSGDHEVGASCRDHTVSGDGSHGDGSQHRLQ